MQVQQVSSIAFRLVDDWEVVKSADAILQTYDTSRMGRAAYRTALVLRQHRDRSFRLNGERPPYGLFLVEAGRDDADQPNSVELRAHDRLEEAIQDAVQWLGVDRRVAPEAVPQTVLTGVANVMRHPALLTKYAP